MEDLASRFGSSVQRLEEVAKNWSDLRNELVRLRINRELERYGTPLYQVRYGMKWYYFTAAITSAA